MSVRPPSLARPIVRARATSRRDLEAEVQALRERLDETEAALHAMGSDDVDALAGGSREGSGPQVARRFVPSTAEGALTVTEDGTILHANRRFCEMVGRTDVTGMRLGELLSPGSALGTLLLSADRDAHLETELLHVHGGRSLVCLSAHTLSIDGGRRIGVIAADATTTSGPRTIARKRAAGQVGPTPVTLDALLEYVPVGLVLIEAASGMITYANRYAEQVLGRELANLEQPISHVELTAWRPDGTIVEPEQLLVARVIRGEGPVREDLARVRGDGTIVQTRAAAVPVLDDRGDLVSVVLAVDDVTDEWLARIERDENERFRELFIGMLGHDLRDPLAALVTGTSFLRDVGTLSPSQGRIVERLASSAQRMGRMVDQILDFTRSRLGGGITLVRSPMSLHELVSALVGEQLTRHASAHIDVELQGTGMGHWDPDRMGQVVSNLLSNALRYGKLDGQVRVSVRDETADVRLEVHNEGAPIPAEVLPFLFDPFRRGNTRSHKDGLGLGLYIAQQIVRAHGGALTVESSEGSGTTFTLVLPRIAL
ncbi:MAG TPA: PAS domain-containing sensor histidine kinase [Polyangiaceae bacterium]|jgi:PAS domain S-box-containing protein